MLNDAGSATLRLCDWLVELWFRASNTIGRLCILGEARNTWNARAIRTLLWTGAVHAWDMRSGLRSSLLEWPACLSPNLAQERGERQSAPLGSWVWAGHGAFDRFQ